MSKVKRIGISIILILTLLFMVAATPVQVRGNEVEKCSLYTAELEVGATTMITRENENSEQGIDISPMWHADAHDMTLYRAVQLLNFDGRSAFNFFNTATNNWTILNRYIYEPDYVENLHPTRGHSMLGGTHLYNVFSQPTTLHRYYQNTVTATNASRFIFSARTRFEEHYSSALHAYKNGHIYNAIRWLSFAIHYLQDIGNTAHSAGIDVNHILWMSDLSGSRPGLDPHAVAESFADMAIKNNRFINIATTAQGFYGIFNGDFGPVINNFAHATATYYNNILLPIGRTMVRHGLNVQVLNVVLRNHNIYELFPCYFEYYYTPMLNTTIPLTVKHVAAILDQFYTDTASWRAHLANPANPLTERMGASIRCGEIFYIKNLQTGTPMGVRGASTALNARIELQPFTGANNQRFRAEYVLQDGSFKLVPMHATNRRVRIEHHDGGDAMLANDSTRIDLRFRFTYMKNGYYRITVGAANEARLSFEFVLDIGMTWAGAPDNWVGRASFNDRIGQFWVLGRGNDTLFTSRPVSGGVEITGASRVIVGSASMPNRINGQPVVAIGPNAFNNQPHLTHITIPATVTTIGNNVFSGATRLRSITNNRITPQTVNANTFEGINRALIRVTNPAGTYQQYRNRGWTGFILVNGKLPLTLRLGSSSYTAGASFRRYNIYVDNPNTSPISNFRHFTRTSYNGDARNLTNYSGHRRNAGAIGAGATIRIQVDVQLAGVRYFAVWFDHIVNSSNTRHISVGGRINLHSSDWIQPEIRVVAATPEVCGGNPGGGGCVLEGTYITLYDGSRVRVENLRGDEYLRIWNFYTGQFDARQIFFINSGERMRREILHLQFADGTYIRMTYQHAFFNITLNRFVDIHARNYSQFVGDYFKRYVVGPNGELTWQAVRLNSVNLMEKYARVFAPQTLRHFSKYANGFLAAPSDHEPFLNVFEVDRELLMYCADAREEAIATFGLMTFEEFSAIVPIVPEFFFDAFRGEYLSIMIGNGSLTWEHLFYLLEKYADLLGGIF